MAVATHGVELFFNLLGRYVERSDFVPRLWFERAVALDAIAVTLGHNRRGGLDELGTEEPEGIFAWLVGTRPEALAVIGRLWPGTLSDYEFRGSRMFGTTGVLEVCRQRFRVATRSIND